MPAMMGCNSKPSTTVNVVREGHPGTATCGKKGNQYVGKTYVDRIRFGTLVDVCRPCDRRSGNELRFDEWNELQRAAVEAADHCRQFEDAAKRTSCDRDTERRQPDATCSSTDHHQPSVHRS